MVAKSYINLEQLGEPYRLNNKMYVKVRMKNGTEKQVRWYSVEEFHKMYPDMEIPEEERCVFKPQHDLFGFDKGYITIFKGETYPCLEWFKQSNARYCRFWGWYVVSTEEVPKPLPSGIEPIQLNWELVGKENGSLKNEDEIQEAIEGLIYEPGTSNYVGEEGERLELNLTVERNIPLRNDYGESTMHIMKDEDGNIFVWTTASKSWTEGTQHHLRGTVKAHKTYKNNKQTILSRCMEVK